MYDWLAELVSAPTGADPVITTCAALICVLLFILGCDIFVNSLFGLFRRRK